MVDEINEEKNEIDKISVYLLDRKDYLTG